MAIVIVDGNEVDIGDQERLNGIQAAAARRRRDSALLLAPGPVGRGQLPHVPGRNGHAKTPRPARSRCCRKLVPACQTPATDGTVFVTNSEKVQAGPGDGRGRPAASTIRSIARSATRRASACCRTITSSTARRSGGPTSSRSPAAAASMGDTVTLFVDRCVMCSRCVRFTREITGTSELMVINRGSHEEIDVFPGYPLDNKLSGNVVDLCPVGALGDKDFLYQQRVWFMKSHDSVCAGCSTGCSIKVEENQDRVYRLKPRENPHVNQWWMCDEGRYGYHHVHSPSGMTRTAPSRRQRLRRTSNGRRSLRRSSTRAVCATRGRLAAVLSPHLTVEEAYLLAASTSASIDPERDAGARPGAGRRRGRDDSRTASRSTPRSAPTAAASRQIVAHFSGRRAERGTTFWPQLDAGEHSRRSGSPAAITSRGSTTRRRPGSTASPLLIVQDLFDSPLWQRADVSTSRRRLRRARRLVRQLHRPAAIVQLGHPPAGRRAGRRPACTGNCWACAGMYNAAQRAGRSRRRDSATSPPPADLSRRRAST